MFYLHSEKQYKL